MAGRGVPKNRNTEVIVKTASRSLQQSRADERTPRWNVAKDDLVIRATQQVLGLQEEREEGEARRKEQNVQEICAMRA